MIYVTKTYLPPIEEYLEYVYGIWDRNHLTNNGPLVKELENRLKAYLSAKHLSFVSNGTVALQIAIKALGLKREIITTPFSYVATTSSIIWEGCTPVFVDIDPESLCIDPELIEAAITTETTAILAVHVYGNPCDVEQIQEIANRHKLKVIYDAAHTFGVTYKGQPLYGFGDASALSFHATKLFHTTEGGAIIANSDGDAHTVENMRRFGHKTPVEFWGLGINGKNSEFHAAMGLCVLPRVQDLIEKRRNASLGYDALLGELFAAGRIRKQKFNPDAENNYGYYPIILSDENELLHLIECLNAEGIVPRRYFYPSLNTLNYVESHPMPVSESISARVLCLPMSHDLTTEQITNICGVVNNCLRT